MDLSVFIIVWVLFAIAAAFIAHTKGRDAGLWFILGLLLGIIAVVIVAVMQKEDPSGKKHTTPWQCPKCKQNNAYWDKVCIKCGTVRE